MLNFQKFSKEERAAVMVEFALVAMTLMLILIGIIQFGLVFSIQLSMDNAAQTGVRLAAIPSSLTDAEIKSTIIDQLSVVIDDISTNDITITPTIKQRNEPVTVSIDYEYDVLVTLGVLPETYNLTAQAVMMRE